MFRIATVFMLLFLLQVVKGQLLLKGRVVDSSHKAIVKATIVIMKDSLIVAGTFSNELGAFSCTIKEPGNNVFTIRISVTGYRSFLKKFIYPDTVFLKDIFLVSESKQLQDVKVTGAKPLVSRKGDRYIVNVENSFLANGNSGLEVLQKIPGLRVDNNGGMYVKGNTPVTVMINEVVQRMSADALQEYLQTLRSEDISKIEIISNPPSEYEAQGAGGIVHIILKKVRKNGLNGSVNSQYRQQSAQPYVAAGGMIDYQFKNTSVTASYSVNKDIRPATETSDIVYSNDHLSNSFASRTDEFRRSQVRLTVLHDFNKRHSITAQSLWNTIRFQQFFNTNIKRVNAGLLTTGYQTVIRNRYNGFSGTTVNYSFKTDTLGSSVKILADYAANDKAEKSAFSEKYSAPSASAMYRNDAPNATGILSVQADYNQNFKGTIVLKAGAKFVDISRDNQLLREDSAMQSWINNPAVSNHFIYNEQLLMGYTSFERSVLKINVKIGLRAEHTRATGKQADSAILFSKHYTGLFPSIYLSRPINSKKDKFLFLNYSRRIARPSLSDLNPARIQFGSNTTVTGNPDISPQYAHSLEAGMSVGSRFSATLYITETNNIITLIAGSDSNNFINYQTANLNHSTEAGVTIYLSSNIIKNWSVMNSVEASHLTYTFNDMLLHSFNFSARSVHNIHIEHITDMDITASFRAANKYSNISNRSSFYMDIGFTKKVMRKQGTFRLSITDIFNSLSERELTSFPDFYIRFARKRATRTIGLSFNYNFSFGKHFETRKTELTNEVRGRI